MELTRRQLLKLSGLGLGGVLFAACTFDRKELRVESPAQIPEDMVTGLDTWYATLCRECGAAEGIIVRVMEGRAKKIEGNPAYPLNFGKHSARCEATLQALYHPDRVRGPLRRVGSAGQARFEPISWAAALDQLTAALVQQQGDPGSVLFATDALRGHLAYLVQQFTKSYGARHAVFEPTEETALYETIKRLYGQDALPHFDIANAGYVLSFGSDLLSTWLNPVAYMRQYGEFRQGKGRKRGTLVQIEPRFSMTAASADEWVPVKPGYEGALALSMAYVIIKEGMGDRAAAGALTGGRGHAALEAFRPEEISQAAGVPAGRIERIAREFAEHQPGLALGGGSAGAHVNGVANLNAIYALNLLVGNTNKPGGVRFNPQAPLPELDARARPTPMGQWKDLLQQMKDGRFRVLVVRGTDPLYGLPRALGPEEALGQVPFVVNFASFLGDTSAYADLILPEHTGLEEWGDDVPDPGPGFQTVGFQQPVVREFLEGDRQTADAGSRGFGDVLLAVAEGLPQVQQTLPWKTYRELVMEGARKLHALGRGSVTAPSFEQFWIDLLANGGWWDPQATSRAPAAALKPLPTERQDVQYEGADRAFHLVPFVSNALGDGRSAHLPWLQATPDPITTAVWGTWVEMNLVEAREMGIHEGDVLEISSPAGTLEAPAYPHPAAPRGVVSIPFGQGHKWYGRYAQERGVNVLSILAPATDRDTGAFAWAATKVHVKKAGRRANIAKFEGTFDQPVELERGTIIQVTKPS
ncbi:MAG: 4Fe-4S ferredoxin [Dehalococcoidia bacterium]|nr:4Fe-4S ferredoxin [Dehalococcoidia bacterium]